VLPVLACPFPFGPAPLPGVLFYPLNQVLVIPFGQAMLYRTYEAHRGLRDFRGRNNHAGSCLFCFNNTIKAPQQSNIDGIVFCVAFALD
jgi:hypothetical protein